jgi:hypothetical protein
MVMNDSLIIELDLLNFGPVMAQLKALSNVVKTIGGGSGGAGNSNPFKLNQQYNNALSSYYRAASAQARFMKQNSPVQQPQGGGFISQLGRVIASSRIGANGGLMPLVGQLARLLGPVGTLGLAVIDVTKHLFDLAKQASETGNAFAEARGVSGGTVGQTGQLGAFGAAMGISPQEMAGLSRGLNQSITRTGNGMIGAGMTGVHGDFLPLGAGNSSETAIRVIEGLRRLNDSQGFQKAAEAAQLMGPEAEKLLYTVHLTQDTVNALKRDGEELSRIYGEGFQNKSAEFTTSLNRFQESFKALGAVSIEPFLLPFAEFTNEMTDLVQLGSDLKIFNGTLSNFTENLHLLGSPLTFLSELLKHFRGGGKTQAQKDQENALNRNSEAVNRNTDSKRDGSFGGGPRMEHAFPRSWKSAAAWRVQGDQMRAEARRMGAFGV